MNVTKTVRSKLSEFLINLEIIPTYWFSHIMFSGSAGGLATSTLLFILIVIYIKLHIKMFLDAPISADTVEKFPKAIRTIEKLGIIPLFNCIK